VKPKWLIGIDDLKNYKPAVPKHPIRPGIEFFSDWVDFTQKPKEQQSGWPTISWPGFNHHFGGARPELVILTGETGTGKTTFAMNWLHDQVDQQRPALLISLENGPANSITKLGQMVTGQWSWNTSEDGRTKFGKKLEEWPLHVLDWTGPLAQEIVGNAIEWACIERQVKFVLVDHLEFIDKFIGSRNEAYVIDDCVRWLAGRAAMLDCTIVLVVHPAKRGKGMRNTEIDMDELKGTSGLKQTGGSVLVHHRPKNDSDETWIRLAKIRSESHSANSGGRIMFRFKAESQTYSEGDGFLDWGNG